MKSHEERIKKLLEKAKELPENQTMYLFGSNETINLNEDIQMFVCNWEKLYKT